jgi:hypothetical protein
MYKLHGLASLVEDEFGEPTYGGERLDSSNLPGVAQIHVG